MLHSMSARTMWLLLYGVAIGISAWVADVPDDYRAMWAFVVVVSLTIGLLSWGVDRVASKRQGLALCLGGTRHPARVLSALDVYASAGTHANPAFLRGREVVYGDRALWAALPMAAMAVETFLHRNEIFTRDTWTCEQVVLRLPDIATVRVLGHDRHGRRRLYG